MEYREEELPPKKRGGQLQEKKKKKGVTFVDKPLVRVMTPKTPYVSEPQKGSATLYSELYADLRDERFTLGKKSETMPLSEQEEHWYNFLLEYMPIIDDLPQRMGTISGRVNLFVIDPTPDDDKYNEAAQWADAIIFEQDLRFTTKDDLPEEFFILSAVLLKRLYTRVAIIDNGLIKHGFKEAETEIKARIVAYKIDVQYIEITGFDVHGRRKITKEAATELPALTEIRKIVKEAQTVKKMQDTLNDRDLIDSLSEDELDKLQDSVGKELMAYEESNLMSSLNAKKAKALKKMIDAALSY